MWKSPRCFWIAGSFFGVDARAVRGDVGDRRATELLRQRSAWLALPEAPVCTLPKVASDSISSCSIGEKCLSTTNRTTRNGST